METQKRGESRQKNQIASGNPNMIRCQWVKMKV